MSEPQVPCAAPRRTSAGFTLVEVLVALFVFGLVFGLLQETVSESLKKMADARDEITAGERGQQTLRDFGERIARGENVANEEGDYEEPDGSRRFRYSVTIAPYQMALPADVKVNGPPLSSIFAAPNANGAPAASRVRRIVVRVFRKELGPESALPLVSFIREKPPEDEGADPSEDDPNQQGQQDPQAQEQQGQGQGQDAQAEGVQDGISGSRRGRRGQGRLSGNDGGQQ
jgi:prepilin-type N-terminal cleavage/methylation domain-containing protein